MRIGLFLAVAIAGTIGIIGSPPAAAQGKRSCTFQSLSPAEQSRYQSRYRRRVRLDGQAYADQWLREQVCPGPRTRVAGGKSKKKCRAVSAPVTSMDGSMTVGIIRKCR